MFGNQRRRGRGNQGVAFLLLQVMSVGIENIPPVTLSVIALCTVLYLGVLPMFDFQMSAICLSLATVAPRAMLTSSWFTEAPRGFFSDAGDGAGGRGGGGLLSSLVSGIQQNLNLGGSGGFGGRTKLRGMASGSVRFLCSPFYHLDDMHLYYNMMSWMFKARSIELSLGSEYMLLLLVCSMFLVAGVYLLLSFAALCWAGLGLPLSEMAMALLGPGHCAVGLSGVIFFLKMWLVLEPAADDLPEGGGGGGGNFFIPGFPFPIGLNMLNSLFGGHNRNQQTGQRSNRRHAVWFELIIIQLLVPGVSFTGHLAGILAAYVFHKQNMHPKLLARAMDLREMIRGGG
jgi:membrane associated rhomboid family serine protease